VSAGVDATEIGLLTELYLGIPPRTYVRTRGWSDDALDAASASLAARGWVEDDALTPAGHEAREAMELATDNQVGPAMVALGDDAASVLGHLEHWGSAVRAAGGYIGSPSDLLPDQV
jgi:hypothetical protein